MIGKYFQKRRSLATGVGLAGASIGQFAMPPIIAFLLDTYGLSGTLLVLAALYMNAAVSGALFRPLSQYGPPLPQKAPQPKPITAEGAEGADRKADGETKVFVDIKDEHTNLDVREAASFEKPGETDANSSPVSHSGDVAITNGAVSFSTTNEEKQPLTDAEEIAHTAQEKQLENPDFNSTERNAQSSNSTDEKETEDGEQKDDEEDDDGYGKLEERKALFASTGSIFLVSPTVLDIKDVDENARDFLPHSPTPARQRHEKRKALCNKINNVFDFRVLRSYVTIFYTINCFMCFFGYFSHILFLPGVVAEKGIVDYKKALLVSMCGAGDLISRVSTGFFADLNIIPRYRISAAAVILCGLNIALTLPANSFHWLAVHCFLYGYFGGAFVSLISVVLVDMVGLALMSKNLAVILLIQGIGSSLGQIFLGEYFCDTAHTGHWILPRADFSRLGERQDGLLRYHLNHLVHHDDIWWTDALLLPAGQTMGKRQACQVRATCLRVKVHWSDDGKTPGLSGQRNMPEGQSSDSAGPEFH
ncbi:monocarboxylate transporter [Elysia marginata]|uniref:Monocarboxylate transporter n=1 Tax=Elysia marginata TaxID=1093978 RepID=A0AAV4INE7_9GAST|nr:monocarboxylate transporter [Elysia marginata]